ncbi:uncharacterized protein A1O5_04273 [Cladophialophora psammophila CBS 110553]|uniref:Mitochondrial genome maintenance protein Mgr2 n=1 Tax=Cladophialophora psammophila CBS 110553 TaxID=1182543 RepID=W9XS50_9EURO|nr:uncharacterized protein A1O5_04273 [Cladophialophora psammophila CBS 110553]EXJ73124.1 hypothetical protein A1O5_04273 [Cladophialophora psammophila CBS 110553]
MPPIPPSAQRRGPTWIDKMKMGMLMGGTVGGIMGFIYGTVTIFQYGAGQAGVMRTLGKYMLGSGAMFGQSLHGHRKHHSNRFASNGIGSMGAIAISTSCSSATRSIFHQLPMIQPAIMER